MSKELEIKILDLLVHRRDEAGNIIRNCVECGKKLDDHTAETVKRCHRRVLLTAVALEEV